VFREKPAPNFEAGFLFFDFAEFAWGATRLHPPLVSEREDRNNPSPVRPLKKS
jgi:hypothetical protein